MDDEPVQSPVEPMMPTFDTVGDLSDADQNPFNQLPHWAKFIGYVGFPVVVTMFLLWLFMGFLTIDKPVMVETQRLQRLHNTLTYQQYINRLNVDAAMLRTLSQICANGAKTSAERKECAVAVVPSPPPFVAEELP